MRISTGRRTRSRLVIRGIDGIVVVLKLDVDELINNIEELEAENLDPGGAVISLADLEEPIFRNMNGRSLRGLQSLFSKPSFVLWTTTGCRDGDPYANMMIGLGRLPEYKDVLWSQESELTVIKGEIHLPRLLPDEERNLRLNSGMREIYQNAPANSTNLTIVVRESHLSLEHALEHSGASDFPGYLEIAVRESSVFMISPCESEFFHLCVGVVVGTDHRVLALSRASLSVIRVLPERTILCEDFFHGIDGTLWIHDADTIPSQIATEIAARRGTSLFLSTSSSDGDEVRLSLCDWMTDHGARYFALASRTPRVNSAVMRYLTRKGANIKVFSLDVTNQTNLSGVYEQIVSSMPPIGGVANGAMSLRDKPLQNMSLEDLEVVLQPKVQGSKNLDELFRYEDLEFFILFSSMASIVGNPAQSNYGAAKTFMSTLAAQRRDRGLAASVIGIAMLLGIGYVARPLDTDATIESQMKRFSHLAMSEPEFHTLFAEAVVSGRPNSQADSELLTGFHSSEDTPWYGVAKLSYYCGQRRSSPRNQFQNHSSHRIKEALKNNQNADDALRLLEAAFSQKLGSILQISSEAFDSEQPLMRLGIDSLIAVEIRSWFLKELETDIPILKILGGVSLRDICQDALLRISTAKGESPAQDIQDSVKAALETTTAANDEVVSSMNVSLSGDELKIDSTHSPDIPVAPNTTGISFTEPCNPVISDDNDRRSGEMSYAQARLYFLHNYLDDKTTHNVGYIGVLHAHFDPNQFQRAIDVVASCHESLRSSYFLNAATDLTEQVVHSKHHIIFKHGHITNIGEVQAEIARLGKFIFDIENGRVIKIIILSKSLTKHHILLFHHHIALDGASWQVFNNYLSQAYSGRKDWHPVQQSIDLSRRERSECSVASLRTGLEFWKKLHWSPTPPLPLFSCAKVQHREVLTAYNTLTLDEAISASLTSRIRHQASRLGVTPFHFYLSVLAVFLSQSLDIETMGIGIMDANRSDERSQETIGCFMNILPLKIQVARNEQFGTIARRTRDMALRALNNSRVPFDMVLDHVRVAQSRDHHPLFQIQLNYRNRYITNTPLDNTAIEWTQGIAARNPYDITIDITETSEGTRMHFSTQQYLYGESESTILMKRYICALEGLSHDTSTIVSNYPIMGATDSAEVTSHTHGDLTSMTWEGTILHRIEEMAFKFPEACALKDAYGSRMTYMEMMTRANDIAAHLSDYLLPIGSRIAMAVDPMADHVCCLLAVLRLGLLWVPLDLRNHHERLSTMVKDCQPSLLVCNGATRAQARLLLSHGTQLVNLDNVLPSTRRLENRCNPHQSAGVLLSNASILGREVVLQHSALGFDISLDQTFHALANGGVLVIAGKEDRGDPVRLAQIMLSENYLAMLNYGLQWLKRCEKLTPQLRRGLQKLELINLQLINAGVVPYHTKEDVNSLADYLWPMPNYSISIMDEHQHCLPIGFAGEMCIAGPGLCLGYLNRPEETKRAFIDANIPSPSRGQLHPSKLYRTGDRRRLLADGSLQVLGRIKGDGQVKIRGLRVELDEIANVIIQNSSGAISNAAVSYRAESDLLIAFVFVNLLKMELPLPSYMRPSIISILDHIPINVNGKLDRAAVNSLPIPTSHLVVNSSTNDLTASEQQVAKIWNELLGSRMASDLSLTPESDFFHVGGNSMLAIGLRSALRATFGLSTVRRMALLLQPVSTESANCMDWKAEISEVSRSLSYERRPISAVRQRQSPSAVLLTGATGFLGTQILRRLVANPEVQKIYCIAIRRDSVGNQQHVSIQSNKIVEYAGDLTSRQFGLSDEDFEFLGQQSDLIIHNSAKVSYLKTYQSLRCMNIIATQTLCELALLHRIPFHYVSTAGVANIRNQVDMLPEVSLSQHIPVSECLLEVAALEHNLPVWIHRPTTILSNGAPEQDLMPAIIKYSRILRAVPKVEELNVKSSLDLVEIEQVSQDLVNATLDSLNSIPEQQVALSFIHHCNTAKISPSKLGNYLEQLDSVKYRDLFLHKWVQEALNNGLSRLVHDYLYTIMHRGRLIVLPGITRNQPL
ncbi:hypothetical protein F4824DRAFT_507516 [Ustulina deusta]|nr:hypothetical protein F4824DRAFT_507516 [Ustulina deusta]